MSEQLDKFTGYGSRQACNLAKFLRALMCLNNHGLGNILACSTLLLLLSCGGAEPNIEELRWQLNVQFTPRVSNILKDNNTVGVESLSVFIRPMDDDGMEDLDSMYLINRSEDLFWALDSSQWQTSTDSGSLWVGSNQFSSGYMGSLPRGEYIVELYDKAGEVAQRSFRMQAPDTRTLGAEISVPPIGDELLFLLPKDVSQYSITGYNLASKVLFVDANYQSIISLKELKIRNDELETVVLSFTFPDTDVVAQLGPYMVPRISSDRRNLTTPGTGDVAAEDVPVESPEGVSETSNTSKENAVAEDQPEDQPIDTHIPSLQDIEAVPTPESSPPQ